MEKKPDLVTGGGPGIAIARAAAVTAAQSILVHPFDVAMTRQMASLDAESTGKSLGEKLRGFYKALGVTTVGRFWSNILLFGCTPPVYVAAKEVMKEESAKNSAITVASYAQAYATYPYSKKQTAILMGVKKNEIGRLVDGNAASLFGARNALSALTFLKVLETSQSKSDTDTGSAAGKVLKGIGAGALIQIPISAAVTPLNILGTRLQRGHIEAAQDSSKKPPTTYSMAKEMYGSGGLRSFFKVSPHLIISRALVAGAASGAALALISLLAQKKG